MLFLHGSASSCFPDGKINQLGQSQPTGPVLPSKKNNIQLLCKEDLISRYSITNPSTEQLTTHPRFPVALKSCEGGNLQVNPGLVFQIDLRQFEAHILEQCQLHDETGSCGSPPQQSPIVRWFTHADTPHFPVKSGLLWIVCVCHNTPNCGYVVCRK